MRRRFATLALAAVSVMGLASTGCQSGSRTAGTGGMSKTVAGAGLGTAAGALTGAIIGHQTGHAGAGALIGAAAGGLGGGLVGNSMDKSDEREQAIAHAHFSEQARQADARALSNTDVISMSQQKVSDRIIISAIQTRGGRFQTDPQSLVHLNQSGVSDDVIQCMLRYSSN